MDLCESRAVPCPQCEDNLRSFELEHHMAFVCGFKLISCPHGCGETQILKLYLKVRFLET